MAHIIGGGKPQQQPNPNQTTINVDLSTCDDIKCPCGSVLFIPTIRLKKISALQSPSGQPQVVQLPSPFICQKCGAPYDIQREETKSDDKHKS